MAFFLEPRLRPWSLVYAAAMRYEAKCVPEDGPMARRQQHAVNEPNKPPDLLLFSLKRITCTIRSLKGVFQSQ
jgi:hypothetical protein